MKSLLRHITLIVLGMLPIVAVAWDGTSVSTGLASYGEGDNKVYLVNSAEDLKYLQMHSELWDQHIIQTGDIDLSGNALGMIGYGNHVSGPSNDPTHSTHHPFSGTYDGQGHVIKNLRVNWNTVNATQSGFGLFGYLTGTVRNLKIEDAVITRTSSVATTFDGIKIGVVAGAASGGAVIENVIVVRPKINDGGQNPVLRALFVGGIVGDVTYGYGSTYVMIEGHDVKIRNAVVLDADVDFNATTHNATYLNYQMNFGGIVGRMRRAKVSDLPQNTYFSGSVNIPQGTAAPGYGFVRGDGSITAAGGLTAYSGQVMGKAASQMATATESSTFFIVGDNSNTSSDNPLPGFTPAPGETLYFGDYQLYNTATNKYETITATYPAPKDGATDAARRYGVRTLDNVDGVTPAGNMQAYMRTLQGVNHAVWINPADNAAFAAMIADFNAYNTAGALSPILIEGGDLQHAPLLVMEGYGHLVVHNGTPAGYTYEWHGERASDRTDEVLAVTTEPEYTVSELGDYYRLRVVVRDPDGKIVNVDALDNKFTLVLERTTSKGYIASVYLAGMLYAGGVSNVEPAGVTNSRFKWEMTTEITDNVYEHVNPTEPHRSTYMPDPELYDDAYLRVTYSDDNGVSMHKIIGPRNRIFVYNKAQTMEAYAQGRTTFDGTYIDRADGDQVKEYPDGDDNNLGMEPMHAVKTMERAYELLDENADYDVNLIVVMGYYRGKDKNTVDGNGLPVYDAYLKMSNEKLFAKSTTVKGEQDQIKNGVITMIGAGTDPLVMGGATKFEYITFDGRLGAPGEGSGYNHDLTLNCNMHDIYVGEEVKIINYTAMGSTNGCIGKINATTGVETPNAPAITLVGGIHNNNKQGLLKYGQYNKQPGVVSITLLSGVWGRVIGGARNSQLNTVTNNVFGSPESPYRSNVTIGIKHVTGDIHEYSPGKTYDYDVNLLVGGQTDGSIYAETRLTLNSGLIGRFISGNISYSREAGGTHPSDTYFGDVELNIFGGTITEMYGGNLGRFGDSANGMKDRVGAYFYGRSVITVDGGTIKGNIYGGGAGGTMGLGNNMFHTDDPYIPYRNGKTIEYGPYDEARIDSIPSWTAVDGVTTIDLRRTQARVNLVSGTINGDVYGGGYGYSSFIRYDRATAQAGNFYGTAEIVIDGDRANPVQVNGSIYGGSAGSGEFYRLAQIGYEEKSGQTVIVSKDESKMTEAAARAKFEAIARVFGETHVVLRRGVVEGNVFAGSRGVEGFHKMSTVFGTTRVELDGGTVKGNIFGGCDFATVRDRKNRINVGTEGEPEYVYELEKEGDTYVEIKSGVVGNCVFGGSQGTDAMDTMIEGSTHVTVTGGEFIDDPYFPEGQTNPADGSRERTFNIYGGGFRNCIVAGSSNVNVHRSLLKNEGSVSRPFMEAWGDIAYRHFCIYGGGWGEKALVCDSAKVVVTLYQDLNDPEQRRYEELSEQPVDHFLPGQMFFDVSAGGYSGSVGSYRSAEPEFLDDNYADFRDHDYFHNKYEGGDVSMYVAGMPVIRKLIGGGFYSSVKNTDTNVKGGQIGEVYGGALLGYVHDRARTVIGTRSSEEGETAETAKDKNSNLFIIRDIYGGNDVKGIVGTSFCIDPVTGYYAVDNAGDEPLYQSYINENNNSKGVRLGIYGGVICGNIYGAGNGHYRGYYVPEWNKYRDGPERCYRYVRNWRGEEYVPGVTPDSRKEEFRTYKSRPMTGIVRMNIRGNSADYDPVVIHGNVYGGGRSCTVGQWNTLLPFEDPRRLVRGGYVTVNVGSNVTIGNLYLGSRGSLFSNQSTVPEEMVGQLYTSFDGNDYEQLDALGTIAYDHWYFNTDHNRYEPGFPEPGMVGGNLGMYGAHMYLGYLKNIEMNGDVNLTFYNNPYNEDLDEIGWIPGELAVNPVTGYDATNVRIGSLFLGGECGSMTNNKIMQFTYDEGGAGVDPDEEEWGAIYRMSLPQGLTILNKVVCGSENALTYYYPYNSDFTEVIKDEPMYQCDGGVVTQAPYAYSTIYYNYTQTVQGRPLLWYELPDDFDRSTMPMSFDRSDPDDPTKFIRVYCGDYIHYKHSHVHTDPAGIGMQDCMDTDRNDSFYTAVDPATGEMLLDGEGNPLRVRRDPNGLALFRRLDYQNQPEAEISGRIREPYFGLRPERPTNVVMKLTAACKFEPQPIDADADPDDMTTLYGGLIYGGCYKSGYVIGDVVLNVGSDMLGDKFHNRSTETFGEISSLKYNVGRVFGGGYGRDSHVRGNTYVNLLHNFRAMNVFGGGMKGNVYGKTHVTYIGSETESYIFGALYGGGLQGSVGIEGEHEGTEVSLYSGNIDKVYGGSCMGDVYGNTFVYLCDEVTSSLSHLDFDRLTETQHYQDWGADRLIAGSVYGGNDIAGNIILPDDAVGLNHARVRVTEVRGNPVSSDPGAHTEDTGYDKDTPGAVNGYNGFPLIGNLYAGSNGDYGLHTPLPLYQGGKVELATGEGCDYETIWLGGKDDDGNVVGDALPRPNVGRALLDIEGGTIVNAYGGGNLTTVTERTQLYVNYPEEDTARAGFATSEELLRVWLTCHLVSNMQIAEVLTFDSEIDSNGNQVDSNYIFNNQIFRLFGGNNQADMTIQPVWNLHRGFVGSVYSGGNFGRMTYFNPAPDAELEETHGLQLTVNGSEFHAETVYGGGRLGNIEPDIVGATARYNAANAEVEGFTPIDAAAAFTENETFLDAFYGATLNIENGVIDHVYGGNDVSGRVNYGTNVNLRGAISGDVYCAGNGNYVYQYNSKAAPETGVAEEYSNTYGGRYFIIPRMEGYEEADTTAAHKLVAINKRRPNVDRAYLMISGRPANTELGTEDQIVWIRGRAFCGGNASTINSMATGGELSDIRFEIGNNVRINNVYLGSNGETLLTNAHMNELANNFDLSLPNDMPATLATNENLTIEAYPMLLDLYMRAVDVHGVPQDFELSDQIDNAMIGSFYVGGNNGSLMTDHPVKLTFPEKLVIYDRIVGGCYSANVRYKGVEHLGGLIMDMQESYQDEPKLQMAVKSRFEPWKMHYPNNNNLFDAKMVPDVSEVRGNLYLSKGKCMIYGGCYSSGLTKGDVTIDLYSDMASAPAAGSDLEIDLKKAYTDYYGADYKFNMKRAIVETLDSLGWRTFGVVGGGFGELSRVEGNIRVSMLPGDDGKHPSAAAVFGGSEAGTVVGNVTVAQRDGTVLTDLFGGSESAKLYGSTQVLVGWPEYYVCEQSGEYHLDRTDNLSKASTEGWINPEDTHKQAVKKDVRYRKGDIVSKRVVAQIAGVDLADGTHADITEANLDTYFTLVDDDTPNNFQTGLTWDDIEINVGDPTSRRHDRPTDNADFYYYGHGNIYGGGYITASAGQSLATKNTVCYFEDGFTPDAASIGYGGNSTILVWDNPENADMNIAIGAAAPSGATVRDHISIGTGYYKPVALKTGQDVMGKYVWNEEKQRFIHQPSHVLEEDAPTGYYEIVSDGGIYGGGRKVFTQGFRACEINNYGYAGSTPQFPKLLNTCQRIDLLSITDCCLHLEGATDFAAGSVNSTLYALTRIGELEMNSTLDFEHEALNPGIRESSNLHNIINDVPRSRNYMAFFHNVLYLSAITSNVGFDTPYHGANGQIGYSGDFNSDGDDPDASIVTGSYRQVKKSVLDEYYVRDAQTGRLMKDQRVQRKFDRRNVGTSANMIGINNGYTLRVMGTGVPAGETAPREFYGPINGVCEIKLLTLAMNEGGGYIFALNQHDDPNNYLQTTGNFVFPGAAYLLSSESENKYNYIYDDCFPIGHGWENYYGGIENLSAGPNGGASTRSSLVPVDEGHGDCNEMQEVHYWYVNGTHFFYNVTLTAYTHNSTPTEPTTFTLDRNDLMLYLYGIEPGSKFKVKSVAWDPTGNEDAGDIQNYGSSHNDIEDRELDYRLFLSVDNKNADPHDLTNYQTTSFAMQIPRSDYDGENAPADTSVSFPASMVNSYDNYDTTNHNEPLLGITLVDRANNSSKDYYNKYLKEPEKVRIELESVQTGEDGVSEATFTYTINLTVKYLLGPVIEGYPIIENDALPGEYIYANTFDVSIHMDDDNMFVSDRRWYLVPNTLLPDRERSTDMQIRNALAHHTSLDVTDQKFDNDRQVHIPAYYYTDGWCLVYEIVANGYSYYLMPHPDAEQFHGRPYRSHIRVHNYHRMRPYDGISRDSEGNPKLEDLKLVAGSRVYIEDDADLRQFFIWLRDCQDAATDTTPDGRDINPQYAAGMYIFLMNDVAMPHVYETTASVREGSLRFDGTFYGGGHTIHLGDNAGFLADNHGTFYNTGFVATTTDKARLVFAHNDGLIESCFYYNRYQTNRTTTGYGLCPGIGSGKVVNCYQTAAVDPDVEMFKSNGIKGLQQCSIEEFNYGEVAYNLNRFYLKKRYNLHTGTPDGDLLAPCYYYYGDGNYRYANWDRYGVGTPTALRTREIPNYRDFAGIRLNVTAEDWGTITGLDATYHNPADPYDMTRIDLDENDEIIYDEATGLPTYHPLYPDDMICFGQNLSNMATTALTEIPGVPTTVNSDNRVYRASGYYGTHVDQGYYFNKNAVAHHPLLTAIDFVGYRDYANRNAVSTGGTDQMTAGDRRWVVGPSEFADQSTYYAPVIDLPGDEDQADDVLESFIPSGCTRNLLVYRPDEARFDVLDDFVYTETTPEDEIGCHVIEGQIGTKPSAEMLHLVDKEDFNAPIAFDVTGLAWYQRSPELYSTGGNGWESICLPFSVETVYATVSGVVRDKNQYTSRDRGLLSHFYGPHEGLDVAADSHEYWLRRFTGVDAASGKIFFARPDSEDDVASNTQAELDDEKVETFHYENVYNSNVYGGGVTSSHARPQYSEGGVDYANYPIITGRLPYIVSFPGERYYEFDLSGQFYANFFNTTAMPSIISYINRVYAKSEPLDIPVTDFAMPRTFTHDGYEFCGTFMSNARGSSSMSVASDPVPGAYGSAFERDMSAGGITVPFRAYVTAPTPEGARHGLSISTRKGGADALTVDDDEEENLDVAEPELTISVELDDLVVRSTYATQLRVFNLQGQLIRILDVAEGENRYGGFAPGYYIVGDAKIRI